jgi:CDP-paratose 2-epimerase
MAKMNVLITGGAGFIGCNTAKALGEQGWGVAILDNLKRKGAAINLAWLRESLSFEFFEVDVRDFASITDLIAKRQFDVVIHLAGQVAVTTSILQPRLDMETNIIGTFNLLEAIRRYSPQTIIINASTNKVYGKLSYIPVREEELRYHFLNKPLGVSEEAALDFHSPYGCSKGAAEQYVVDYARIYGTRSVNFRQSCIYGQRQLGVEDQGWAAWFMIAHLLGRPVTIFGNGKQVRDMLFVDDLIEAYQKAIAQIDSVSGQTFNIGGGPENSLSLLEYIEYLEQMTGRQVTYSFSEFRLGDQYVYISDITRAQKKLNWSPSIPLKQGLDRLYDWVTRNQDIFRAL